MDFKSGCVARLSCVRICIYLCHRDLKNLSSCDHKVADHPLHHDVFLTGRKGRQKCRHQLSQFPTLTSSSSHWPNLVTCPPQLQGRLDVQLSVAAPNKITVLLQREKGKLGIE